MIIYLSLRVAVAQIINEDGSDWSTKVGRAGTELRVRLKQNLSGTRSSSSIKTNVNEESMEEHHCCTTPE